MQNQATPALKAGFPLFALAIGAFGIGVTEFAPMGLLPVIADGVGVSIPQAGILVSVYALGVMLGAPFMTLALSGAPRRKALVLLMAIFTLGNVLAALAPNYTMLVLARLVTSLNHGAFFGLGAVVAASLVPRHKQASAVATVLLGLTIANVGGVPAATWLGQLIGWRMAFAATALLGVLAMLALWWALPAGDSGQRPDFRKELPVLVRPVVLLAMLTTVLSAGAMFTVYTYVAPLLATLTGASPDFVTLALVLIGVGFTIGNIVGGRYADYSLEGSLVFFLLCLIAVSLALPWLATSKIGAALGLLLFGFGAFGVVPPLQMRVMRAAADAPGLAAAVNVGAFNLGNALGAAAGGAVISAGLGYAAVPLATSALAVLTLGVVLRQWRRQRLTASHT